MSAQEQLVEMAGALEFGPLTCDDSERLVAALRGVLGLHPNEHGECLMCSDERGPKPWPCPTVEVVERVLGGEE